jgi:hypothetical protein
MGSAEEASPPPVRPVATKLHMLSLGDVAEFKGSHSVAVPQSRFLPLPERQKTGKASPEAPKDAFFSSMAGAPKLTQRQQTQLQKLLPTSRCACRFCVVFSLQRSRCLTSILVTQSERSFIGRVFLAESEDHELDSVISLAGLKRAFRAFQMNDGLLTALFNAFDKCVPVKSVSCLVFFPRHWHLIGDQQGQESRC